MSGVWRGILFGLLAVTLLLASGCDEIDQEVNQAIKDKTGVDATDPLAFDNPEWALAHFR